MPQKLRLSLTCLCRDQCSLLGFGESVCVKKKAIFTDKIRFNGYLSRDDLEKQHVYKKRAICRLSIFVSLNSKNLIFMPNFKN